MTQSPFHVLTDVPAFIIFIVLPRSVWCDLKGSGYMCVQENIYKQQNAEPVEQVEVRIIKGVR